MPFDYSTRAIRGGYDGDDGNVGGVLLATALGCIVAVIMLVLVAQYTTLPQYICSVLSTPPKTQPAPTKLLREEVKYPDNFVPGYQTPVIKSPARPTGKPKPQSSKSSHVKVQSEFQRFTTGKEPSVTLPGIPQPSNVSGADQVFAANKALLNSVQKKELRQRIAAATWGVPAVYDRPTIGFDTLDPKDTEMYQKAQIRNSQRLMQKGCLGTMFNLPQTFGTAPVPPHSAHNLGRGIEFEH